MDFARIDTTTIDLTIMDSAKKLRNNISWNNVFRNKGPRNIEFLNNGLRSSGPCNNVYRNTLFSNNVYRNNGTRTMDLSTME